MTPPTPQDRIWRLVAISVDPDRAEPQLFALILEGEQDVVLTSNGRILLFTDLTRASAVLDRYAGELRSEPRDVTKPFFWCDVAQTLHLLESGGVDDGACVLGAVNALLDLVAASGISMPPAHRAALHSIADYCTLHRDLTKYLEEEGDFSSQALIGAVLWSVGAVTVRSTIV